MAKTYKFAQKTLVFDSSLLQIDSTVAPEEALIRLRYLPWSSRLWTMQEGRLGLDLYFQLKDKSIQLDKLSAPPFVVQNLLSVDRILEKLDIANLVDEDRVFFWFNHGEMNSDVATSHTRNAHPRCIFFGR